MLRLLATSRLLVPYWRDFAQSGPFVANLTIGDFSLMWMASEWYRSRGKPFAVDDEKRPSR